jgi:energy-converting hydrogenase A subunit C
MMDTVEIIIGLVALLMTVRIFLERSRARKLLYLCCLSFCISALIALYVNSPMGGIVAIIYFITSTLSSNAISYTIEQTKHVE